METLRKIQKGIKNTVTEMKNTFVGKALDCSQSRVESSNLKIDQ